MPQVIKIGHAGLNVPDPDAALAYYTDTLGLSEVDRGKGAVYLGSGADHHSVVLYTDGEPGLRQLAFQISADRTLQDVLGELRDRDIPAELQHDAQPGIAELIQIHDPQGNPVLLYSEVAQVRHGFKDRGIVPHKLGHVAQKVQNIDAMVAFYRDVLGFRESDWMEHFFVFLRCGPDHHTVNFISSPRRGMHHIAFELRDWSHVESASDLLAQRGIPLIWGPGRHGIGHNIFAYHHDPAANIVELFTELDVVLNEELGAFEPRPWHEDFPQRTKVWQFSPTAANKWGILPPEGFME
jgi:catechol-2,3-dioxygenase